jgi:uncharacterized protein (TIGR00369 family)
MLPLGLCAVNPVMSEASPPALPSADDAPDVPEGFEPLAVGGPYFRQLGPIWMRRVDGGGVIVALRVAERHLNVQGMAHGGMLATLADGALGINLGLARGRRGAQVTVSLTADYLSGARPGEWLEAHVVITRMGTRLAYLSCDLKAGERHVLRSSAVFALNNRPIAAAAGGTEPPLGDG